MHATVSMQTIVTPSSERTVLQLDGGCGCGCKDCTEAEACACGCSGYRGRSPFKSAEMARHEESGLHPSTARSTAAHSAAAGVL